MSRTERAQPRLYFDNAATSFPKPPGVVEAMTRYMVDVGASGRGSYAEARETTRLIRRCRERICRLINGQDPDHVVFTHNTSDALNLAIKGVLMHAVREWGGLRNGTARKPHVVLTTMEHNSVLRPVNAMVADGLIEATVVGADPRTFVVDPEDVRRAIRHGQTVLVCINHASNVTGTVQDVVAMGQVCAAARRANSERAGGGDGAWPLLMVDGAQSLGHVGVDVRAAEIDLLAFPGHKGLLGPTGTGGLHIRPGVERLVDTVREGGTGSSSEQETHPAMMPEKYEAGSHNAAGIIGLSEGVAWLLERGMRAGVGGEVREHELALMCAMDEGLRDIAARGGLRVIGEAPLDGRVGVFSLIHPTLSPQELAAILEGEFGILSRAGLACAPLVHRAAAMGLADVPGVRYPGATRLSLGPFLARKDVERLREALSAIVGAGHRQTAASRELAES